MIAFLKVIIYSMIFILCTYLGIIKSREYGERVNTLKNFKEALNIFKTKIRFTYETLPEIFKEIGVNFPSRVGQVFFEVGQNIEEMPTSKAWNTAIEKCETITDEDKNILMRFWKNAWQNGFGWTNK